MVVYADPDFSAGLAANRRDESHRETNAFRSVEFHDFQSISLPPLPGTAREAERLQAQIDEAGWHAQVFLGRDATKAQLQQTSSPRILHLATHGFFLPDNADEATGAAGTPRTAVKVSPMNDSNANRGRVLQFKNPMERSGLALAGATATLEAWARGEVPPARNDGIITAEQVGGLHLKGTWLVSCW